MASQYKMSRPQLRQAISLTIRSVFFPMMFPIGKGSRKSDLLLHRAVAVALIWKIISVQHEAINIILVSLVNDTFLPSIVDLTEKRDETVGGGRKRRRKRGRGEKSSGVFHATGESFTSQTASWHLRLFSLPLFSHTNHTYQPLKNLNCNSLLVKLSGNENRKTSQLENK